MFIEVRRALEGHGTMNAYAEFHVIYGQKLLSVQEILKEEEDNCICKNRPRLGLKLMPRECHIDCT